MKAIQLDQPKCFRVIDIPEPSTPAPGQVLVSIRRVGVCGTDISGYLGKMPFFSYPRIPGHELGVVVKAVGAGVDRVRPGDRCSVEPYINCQSCYACQRGHTNCCEKNQTLGVMCDGGLRELMLLPERKLHISRTLSFEQLALVETLAIGCHAVNRAAVGPGQNVLVVGAGPIGLSVIEFAKLSGARTFVMDINPARLEFVRRSLGVQDTILVRGDSSEADALRQATSGRLADAVIDATGSARSMSQSLDYCAFAGCLVYVGITQQEISFLHAPVLHRREITIKASRNALPGDFQRIIALIEKGDIKTDPWITHRSDFESMPGLFPGWTLPETGVIKAMVAVS